MSNVFLQADQISRHLVEKPEMIERLLDEHEIEHTKSRNGQYIISRCPFCLAETDGRPSSKNNYARAGIYYQNLNRENSGCGWTCYQNKAHYVGKGTHSGLVMFFKLHNQDEHLGITVERLADSLGIKLSDPLRDFDTSFGQKQPQIVRETPIIASEPSERPEPPKPQPAPKPAPLYPDLFERFGHHYHTHSLEKLESNQIKQLRNETNTQEAIWLLQAMDKNRLPDCPF